MALSRLSSSKFLVIAILWLLSIGSSHSSVAQVQWECMSMQFDFQLFTTFVDSTDSTLYIGGQFTQVNGQPNLYIVGVRHDGTIRSLPNPVIWPEVITRWNGKLIVGGGGGLSELHGNTWKRIDSTPYNSVLSLHPYQGKLLVGGMFVLPPGTSSSDERSLMEWDGVSMKSFKGLDSVAKTSGVFSLVEYNGDLIVAGNLIPYPPVDPRFKDIARWTGTSWQIVGPNGLPGSSLDGVNDMVVIKGELYVAGIFREASGSPGNHIAKWDGTQWHRLGDGVGPGWSGIADLEVQGDTLIAAGYFNQADGEPAYVVARYWNGHWCGNDVPLNGPVVSLANYFGTIVAIGGFDTVGTQPCGRLAKVTSWGDCFAQAVAGVADKHSSTGDFQLTASPNPTHERATIAYQAKAKGTAWVTVVDAVGKTLMAHEVPCSAGANEIAIDLKGLPVGIYTLQLSNAEGHGAIKIVKQ